MSSLPLLTVNTRHLFSIAASLLAFATAAQAQTQTQDNAAEAGPPPGWVGPPPGWSGGVLGGVVSAPDFEGSRHSRSQPVLGFEMTYRTQLLGSVAMGSRGVNWTVVQRPEVSAGVGLSIDPGRVDNGERKLTAMGYRPGSDSLRGMGNISMAPVVSASASYTWSGVSLTWAQRHALTSYKGTSVDLGLSVPWKMGAHAQLSIAPSITVADRRTMRAFFGVTPQQSAASGHAVFNARPGVKSAQLALDFDMALSRFWHINATLLDKRLLHDAADSPITQKTNQVSGLVGLLYQFQL